MKRAFLAALAFCGATLLSQPAPAESPLRLIVPFNAGGGSDVLARFIGAELSGKLGQPVVIVNQPGASGYIATNAAYVSPPDGNTLLLANTNHAIFPATRKELDFDVVDDFEPVILMAKGPLVINAHPSVPYKTMPEMIAYAKTHPGALKYGSGGGVGNVTHLAVELLSQRAGISMVHVPYNGAAPAVVDTMAGVIPICMTTIASVLPYYEAGTLFPLATSSKERLSVASNIPTVAEQTGLDYDLTFWTGMVAPPNTPAHRVEQLRKALAEIADSEKGRKFMRDQGLDPATGTSEQFKTFLRAEVDLWIEVARAAKLEKQ